MTPIDSLDNCPECKASWVGEPIPAKLREHWGENAHFSRLIGFEYPGYDGVSHWQCPDCKATWNRWTGKLEAIA